MTVIGAHRRRHVALADLEQRHVPPVMGQHEGIEVFPGLRHLRQKCAAFGNAPLGQVDMGQGVMGPGFLALQGHGAQGGVFGVPQQVALLQPEGEHAVEMGAVLVGVLDHARGGQHAGGIAAVELVVLGEFHQRQVMGPEGQCLAPDADGAGDVARRPGLQGGQGGALALRPPRGRGAVEPWARQPRRRGAFQEQVQRPGIGVGDQAVGVGLGRRQHVHRLGFIGEEAFGEIGHPARHRPVVRGDRIVEPVPVHAPLRRALRICQA